MDHGHSTDSDTSWIAADSVCIAETGVSQCADYCKWAVLCWHHVCYRLRNFDPLRPAERHATFDRRAKRGLGSSTDL